MNLDDYFKRIGYTGSVANDLPTLRRIAFAHATSIPFEGLDPFSGIPVSLDIDALEDKLVRRRRGGYCFEQNGLLAAALREVGFDLDELSARVWYNRPGGTTPPRTHMFLAVTIEGTRWLADCGLGGSTPPGLMQLDRIGEKQEMLGEVRRIVPVDKRLIPMFMHQVWYGEQWTDLYEFTGEAMPKIDQEVGNWWTSSHPSSGFRKNLIVALLNRDGTRYSVRNNTLFHRRGEEILTQVDIQNREQLSDILDRYFGLELPLTADLSSLFD